MLSTDIDDHLIPAVLQYAERRAKWLRICDQVEFLATERDAARQDMEGAYAKMELMICEHAENINLLHFDPGSS